MTTIRNAIARPRRIPWPLYRQPLQHADQLQTQPPMPRAIHSVKSSKPASQLAQLPVLSLVQSLFFGGGGMTPSKDGPVTIIPAIFAPRFSEKNLFFKPDRFLQKDSFDKLIKIFKSFDMKIDRWEGRIYWRFQDDLHKLDASLIQKLREDLQKEKFKLERIVGLEEEASSPAVYIATRIDLGLERSSVAILENEKKAFLIICPDQQTSIHRLVTEELTGVTDEKSRVSPEQSSTIFVTYDIWLVAEFIDLLEQQFPEISLVTCNETDGSLSSRHKDQRARQKPIPEVTRIMNDKCHLHPYQNEGVRFLQENGGNGIISFEMGMGKTATSLAYIASEEKRAIVICPKNVRSNWLKDSLELFFPYFQGRVLELGAGYKSKPMNDDTAYKLAKARLVCINHESLNRFQLYLLDSGFHSIVLDESHLLKNPAAQRTQTVLAMSDFFENKILLSGTPIKNEIEELSSQLKIVGVNIEIKENMSAGAVWNMLHERKLYLKRTMKEELPHLQFADPQFVNVEFSADDVDLIDSEWSEEDIFAQVKNKFFQTADIKAPHTCQFAHSMMSKNLDSKAIIFTERVEIATKMFARLDEEEQGIVLLHHGGLSDDVRSGILEDFRTDASRRILVSTRQSLGVGVNLQCANIVIFNDMPYSPADIQQAAGRTTRVNQKRAVEQYWMKSNTQFDGRLLKILQKKMSLIIQYSHGKNLNPEQMKWMFQAVSFYEIAGIERPKKAKKPKK